jgi:ParB/RepB/Spo0J family partition protein
MNKFRPLTSIKPAPENDAIYAPIAWDDPSIQDLARSIKENGVKEPLLISKDGYIISGHRRRIAAMLAGLEYVPVTVSPISRAKNPKEFIALLVTMNAQRVKTTSDLVHETIVKLDPKDAHQQIKNKRWAWQFTFGDRS